MLTFGCAWEKSTVQRDMTGLTKVLPAPESETFLVVELHAVSAPRPATAMIAATNFLFMKILQVILAGSLSSSIGWQSVPLEMYRVKVTFLRICRVGDGRKWQRAWAGVRPND